ncbi:3-oxoadipate enol-lactonase [Rhodoplanes elegans]|uniref:3-oxoadipate enol-lactonase n=1 Tax=Rhodoplanes elegans TaxID=29408 RepID=A0A327KS79_9BRAD|nr:3-oxoadipate enol-lactonase [Rhodoplanes elegans]MBK5962039.1 3-oxoadipate enol-lactonase [Rhodoplanes elegans]RAI40152.1 3-oxoadipate enol-lactonase [Rhodoplanes elegans]
MPEIVSEGCALHVEVEGPADAPVVMFSNSLGTDLTMWDPQVAPFTRHFRVVRYDRRGHGRSGVTPGPYSIEMLGRDALAIMDGLGLDKVHWVGLSMGGMVGQWLGANAPQRLGKLVLANTSSFMPDKQPWHDRIATVRAGGLAAIVDKVMGIWFTQDFRDADPAAVETIRTVFLKTPVDGYIANCEAVRDMDQRDLLDRIAVPTLVVAGRFDQSTPIEANDFIRRKVPGAQLTILDSAHISNIEQAAAFNTEVLGFLVS